ncbi:MAG: hypothetical protein M4579_001935 [Chaenotheca gracillima]|nr:MAG: hypothetical protein M4579_001935 [Chaenotheca gracillima]
MVESTERPNKRLRRLSTDYDDSEGTDDWIPSKEKSKGKADAVYGRDDSFSSTGRGRPRRSGGKATSSVTVARPPTTEHDDAKRSIRLTMKVPAGKLREATSGQSKTSSTDKRNIFADTQILTGPRGTRAKRAIVEDSASDDQDQDEDEDDEDEGGEEDDDEEEEEEEEDDEGGGNDDDDQDEDMENVSTPDSDDVDADGDVEMAEESIPPPVIKTTAAPPGSRPKLTVTPADEGKVKSVESKEMEDDDDDDDEELSELRSDDEDEDERISLGEEDAEGEEVGEEEEEDDEGDELSDIEGATPASGSRASTPDLSKLTRRQRMRMDEITGGELLELPSESKAKKILSAEEHAMRRAEMARRRKNLSEKRNEEEKMDTINKLLKKQAPKQRRARGAEAPPATAGDVTPNAQEPEQERPIATMTRWISNRNENLIAVPEEWLEAPFGAIFKSGNRSGKLVDEVT